VGIYVIPSFPRAAWERGNNGVTQALVYKDERSAWEREIICESVAVYFLRVT